MKRFLCFGLLAMMALAPAYADEVKITKAWTRATAPGQDSASVQLTILSKRDAMLTSVMSGSAQSGEIHTMVMEGDVMKMRAIDSIPLPARKAVTLGADGNHLMLLGLKNPLKAGRKLPFAVTVKFADGRTTIVRALAVIKPLQAAGDEDHMKMQMQPAAQPEMQHEHHHQ